MPQKSLTTQPNLKLQNLAFLWTFPTESSLFIQRSRGILISRSVSSERNLYHAVTAQIKGNLT